MAEPSVAGMAVRAKDTGRVLMLQRSIADETDPARGTWEFPGGKLNQGETPLQGAVREWQEETGVPLPAGEPAGTWESGPYMGHVFVVPSEEDVPLNSSADDRLIGNPDDPDGDDCETLAWWAPSQAEQNPALRQELKGSPAWEQVKQAVPDAVFKATVRRRRVTIRKRYPTLVRAHVRGSQIDPAALAELTRWLKQHPEIRACEAADHGFDPLADPAKYLAAELAEPAHASLRSGELDQAAIREWETQETGFHTAHPHGVAKEQPSADAVHIDGASDTVSVANLTDGKKRKKPLLVGEPGLDVKVLKADKAKQLVYGIVLEPHRTDSQGDWEDEADIEKACHRYLGVAFEGGATDLVNLQHRWQAPAGVYPVENYIAPTDFVLNGEPVAKGSWVLVVKVGDPQTWQEVLDGQWGGLSVEGTGRRNYKEPVPVAKQESDEAGLLRKTLDTLTALVGREQPAPTIEAHVHFEPGAFEGPHVETHNHLPEQPPAVVNNHVAPAAVTMTLPDIHNDVITPEVHVHATVEAPRPRSVRVEERKGVKRYIPE